MDQPLPEREDDLNAADRMNGDAPNPLGTSTSEEELQTLLDRQVTIIARDTAFKKELPPLAHFAIGLEKCAFEPHGPVAADKPIVVGTTLRPDDDVLNMDATIPRSPDSSHEE